MTAVASLTRVRVVVDHAHNAHPTAKINKVKDLALIFFYQSLHHQDFIFCQKHLEQAFFCVIFSLIFSLKFTETFIVNDKSYCCNDTFTDVQFTSLLAKNI